MLFSTNLWMIILISIAEACFMYGFMKWKHQNRYDKLDKEIFRYHLTLRHIGEGDESEVTDEEIKRVNKEFDRAISAYGFGSLFGNSSGSSRSSSRKRVSSQNEYNEGYAHGRSAAVRGDGYDYITGVKGSDSYQNGYNRGYEQNR